MGSGRTQKQPKVSPGMGIMRLEGKCQQSSLQGRFVTHPGVSFVTSCWWLWSWARRQQEQMELHSPAASPGQLGAHWEGNEEHNVQGSGSGAWAQEQLFPLPSKGSSMGKGQGRKLSKSMSTGKL